MYISRGIIGCTRNRSLKSTASWGKSFSSTSTRMSEISLVLTAKEVKALPSDKTIPIDATWFMPNVSRDACAEHTQKRIPGARFWSLDRIASQHPLGLAHMMPGSEMFAGACESLGISPDSHVVLYDTHGVFSSPRALMMFKAFGHKKVSILNGGLPSWEAEGLPVESGEASVTRKTAYPKPGFDENAIRSYEDIVKNSTKNMESKDAELVLDARPNGRFTGTVGEPRPGLSSGHMPNSISVPFGTLLETHSEPRAYTTLLPPGRLREVLSGALGPYASSALTPGGKRKIVNTCGSGMTAAIIWLALQQIGVSSSLYDESWTGYAMRPESVIHKS